MLEQKGARKRCHCGTAWGERKMAENQNTPLAGEHLNKLGEVLERLRG